MIPHMATELRTLTDSQSVLDLGCKLILEAPPSEPVRVISYLGRWYYPAAADIGCTEQQLKLRNLLNTNFKTYEPRPQIRVLLFCADEESIYREESVLEFLRYGASLAHAPVETPIRVVTTGGHLLVAINPNDLATPGPLVSYGVYYRAEGHDPMISMIREIFDRRFADADRLLLDRTGDRASKGTRFAQFWRQLRPRFSAAETAYRLIWILVGILLGLILSLVSTYA